MQHKKPNKQEARVLALLQKRYPECWNWNGGVLTFGNHVPDFVHEPSKRKIIEFFGTYWHALHEVDEKKEFYAEYGFEVFIIWESELDNALEMVERLDKFMEE